MLLLRPTRDGPAVLVLGERRGRFWPVVCGLCDIQPFSNIALDIVIHAPYPNSLVVIMPGHMNHTLVGRLTKELALLLTLQVLP